MGKDSSPDIHIPKPPDIRKTYKQGANVYLEFLDKFLNREQDARSMYDPARIREQQNLQDEFGPTQYRQMLDSLKALDPTGYNLREQTGSALSKDLAAGTHLTKDQEQELEQEIRRSQSARGNTYGQAPVQAEAFTKGRAGQELYQQRLSNAMQFQNSATPEQWLAAVPPVSPDRSMAYVNPNAGFQGQQFQQQNFQNQVAAAGLNAQGGGSSPWMSALGSIAGIVGPILGGLSFSDARVKTGIQKVGQKKGIGLYKFAYKNAPDKPMIGHVAQDVQRTRPDAVEQDPASGLMKVNYRKLGIMSAPQPASADTQPAMLKPGEVVLNKSQQHKVGASRIFKAIGNRHGKALGHGVRAYSGGGLVPGDINDQYELPTGGNTVNAGPGLEFVPGGEPWWEPPGELPSTPNNQTPSTVATGGGTPGSYVPPPPGAGNLVPPPNVNMPPNEQPPPNWVKFASRLSPVIGAGYNAFRLGQRLGEMYRNAHPKNNSGSGEGSQPNRDLPPGGYYSPAYLRSIGYEPGQGTNSLWPGAGPSAGPNGVGDYGVGGQGGSFFHQLQGGRATPVSGSFSGLGSFDGGALPTTFGAWRGARSPVFRGYLSAFGMTPHQWELSQRRAGGAGASGGYTGRSLNKSGD